MRRPLTPRERRGAALIGLALVLGLLAARFKLPPLLGYLLAGITIGPHTPGFVADIELAAQLAAIGRQLAGGQVDMRPGIWLPGLCCLITRASQ